MTREARTNCLPVMLLVAGLVADAIGLVVPLPPMAQVHLVKMPVLNNAAHCIFPTANLIAEGDRTVITSFEFELEQLAEEQARQQQAMNAKKAERAREQEEAEARAQAAYELAQRLQAEQQARAEAMAAKAKASAEARAAAKAGAKADADAAKASRVAKAVGGGAKAAKYGEVQRVNKQAERIAERIAVGEDSPLCFYGVC